MSTRFLVRCPHEGCNWTGKLAAEPVSDLDAWRGKPATVAFECPRCHQEWQAQVIGDQVQALPLEMPVEESKEPTWPLVDTGVGD